jgi:cysteine synthase A
MARYLVKHDGLFIGSSSACNLVACVRLVKKMGWHGGERIVTVMCVQRTRSYADIYLTPGQMRLRGETSFQGACSVLFFFFFFALTPHRHS